ncbi:ATP-binding cassette domain-containing protein [Paenibacillus thermotolerans]|nr:ABC transporter ATP-binding protein [Paenibacillus sp. YIM B05601]
MKRKAVLDTLNMLLLPLRLILIKLVIDSIQLWGRPGSVLTLIVLCAFLAILMTASAFIGSSSLLMHTRIYEIGTLQKERAVVEKTARLPFRLTELPAVKDLRNRALMYSPDSVYLEGMSLLLNSLQTVFLFGVICWMGYWPLAIFLISFGSFQGWLFSSIDARLEHFKINQTSTFRLADHIHNLLISKSPAKEMRIFGLGSILQQRWIGYFQDASKRNEQALVKSERSKLVPEMSLALISGVAILIIMLTSTSNSRSAGDYVMLFQCITILAGAIPNAVKQVGTLTQMVIRGHDFISYRELEDDRFADETGYAGKIGLKVERLVFRYDKTPYRRPTLQQISFEIEPGSKVAIVGENGSGKSTLVKLLLGLYNPDEGTVRWMTEQGAVNAGDSAYRASVVFQDFTRYQLSLRENVAVGDMNNIEEDSMICNSLEKAGIGGLTTRIDEIVGTEFGRSDLSGGQWQKVAVARAFMRGESFLVFDEPTASLDPKAEKQSFSDFLQAAAGQTAILVTHRLGAARLADRIIVLKEGNLVEQGTHEQLMERQGEYARLYHLQSAWYA